MPSQLKLNMWASQIALCGCFLLALGAIPCFYYPNGAIFGGYALGVAFIVGPFLYPVTQLGAALALFQSNFWASGIILIVLSIACFIVIPTTMGGASFIMAAIVYFIAAFKGETGQSCATLSKPPAQRRGDS